MLLVTVMLNAALSIFFQLCQRSDFSEGNLPQRRSVIDVLLGEFAVETSEVRYFSANVDLNDDGTDEVIPPIR
jgi:hypothetical protein